MLTKAIPIFVLLLANANGFSTGIFGLQKHRTRVAASAKKITFEAKKVLRTDAAEVLPKDPRDHTSTRALLDEYFESDLPLKAIFSDALSVEPLSSAEYRAVLPMSAFPGIKVTSSNRFHVTRKATDSGPSMEIKLIDSKAKATGPKVLVAIFDAANAGAPKTSSANIVSANLDDEGRVSLFSDVFLRIELEIPSWVPIPADILQTRGSKALEALLNTDVKPKLEMCLADFLEEAKQSKAPSPS